LLRLAQPEVFVMGGPGPEWTPDSRAVMFVKDIGARREVWLVPVAEGRPRRLDIDPDIWLKGSVNTGQQFFSLSPDGRSIAFQMGTSASEVWVLENFLPTSTANKPTARK
jgi:Tol biopolymer transport system component